jgi:hypothetical protein
MDGAVSFETSIGLHGDIMQRATIWIFIAVINFQSHNATTAAEQDCLILVPEAQRDYRSRVWGLSVSPCDVKILR